MDSPYKVLFQSQEYPWDIQGTGEMRTSWIGQQGVVEIKRTMWLKQSNDKKKLESSCYKAFKKAGLLMSESKSIKVAVELCHIQKLPQEGENISYR